MKHEEKATCACGANTYCPHCGEGRGVNPCACSEQVQYIPDVLHEEILTESLKEHAAIWERLAGS